MFIRKTLLILGIGMLTGICTSCLPLHEPAPKATPDTSVAQAAYAPRYLRVKGYNGEDMPQILIDPATNVEYLIWNSAYGNIAVTPRLDKDGKPRLFTGKEE